MQSIPSSLVEAARVDGAGHWRAFWSIVVPVSRNSIITAALVLFPLCVERLRVRPDDDDFEHVPAAVTLGIYNYLGSNIQSWAPVMATATLASASRRSFCSCSPSGTSPRERSAVRSSEVTADVRINNKHTKDKETHVSMSLFRALPDGLEIRYRHEVIRVQAWGANSLRVRAAIHGHFGSRPRRAR